MSYNGSATAALSANDDALLRICKAVLAADVAFHAACNTGQDDDVIRMRAQHRQALIAPLLATHAQTPEGMSVKTDVISALYDWPDADEAESRNDLIASLVSALVTVTGGSPSPDSAPSHRSS
jgi:hypothetical protein